MCLQSVTCNIHPSDKPDKITKLVTYLLPLRLTDCSIVETKTLADLRCLCNSNTFISSNDHKSCCVLAALIICFFDVNVL